MLHESLSEPVSAAERPADNRLFANLNRPEIPSLNGIRALAALIVIMSHLGFNQVPGSYGVTAFFVLSGFLITHLLIKEQERTGSVSLRLFFLRRSLRIFPAFYVFATIYVTGRLLRHLVISWPQVIAALTYTSDYYQAIVHPVEKSMGHAWSLAVEEQFYLVWPFVFWHYRHSRVPLMKSLVWVILFIWIYRAALSLAGVNGDYIYYAADMRMDSLAIGCVAALAIHNRVTLPLGRWIIGPVAIVCVFLLPLASRLRFRHFDFNATVAMALLPILFCIIILHSVWFAGHPMYSFLNNPVARYLGLISYPLYLYHPMVGHIFGNRGSWIRLPGEFAVCVALASASYFIVEKPFLRLKRHLSKT